jgi:hypothetical protein
MIRHAANCEEPRVSLLALVSILAPTTPVDDVEFEPLSNLDGDTLATTFNLTIQPECRPSSPLSAFNPTIHLKDRSFFPWSAFRDLLALINNRGSRCGRISAILIHLRSRPCNMLITSENDPLAVERIHNGNPDEPPTPTVWWVVRGYESLGDNIGCSIHGFTLSDEADKEDNFRGLAGQGVVPDGYKIGS